MRFDSLKLKAYGHFTDYLINFDDNKNFHLLYGPNEAGKSTTLRSISNFLYGFPQKTNDAFLHGNSHLRIEGQLRKLNGEVLSYIRRKGRKNTVLSLDETPMNEKVVEQFLQGLSESQFKSMFALNHETLREGGESLLHSGGSAGEGLFAAASGITILRSIMDNLTKETGNLYKKTGSIPQLNKLLQQEKELNKKMAENQLKIQTWKDLERQYHDGKKEIEKLINKVKELRQTQRKLDRIKQMLPKISTRQDLMQKMADLGDVPTLPDDVTKIRSSAETNFQSAMRDKQKLEKDMADIQEQLQKIEIPKQLLDQASIVDALYREFQSYQSHVNRIPELEGKRKQFKDQVLTLMKEIDGAHDDFENVSMFRLSAEKKETIRELIKEKPLLDQNLTNSVEERKKSERELLSKKNELANMQELPSIDELEAVIDKVKRADAIEATIEKLAKACNQQKRDINEAIRLLPLWEGSEDKFATFTVPVLTETIKKFEKEQNELVLKRQKIQEQIKLQQDSIEQYEESIRQLDSRAEIPSEEKLLDIRKTRDTGWKIIRKKVQSGVWDENLEAYTNGENIEVVFEKQVQEADQISDTMRIAAEQVGEKNKLLADIKTCKAKIADLEEKESSLRAELKSWEEGWSELWKATGISPLTPVEMQEWLGKYSEIKASISELKSNLEELHELEEKKEQLKTEMIQVLTTFGKASLDKSLNELLLTSEQQLKAIRELTSKQENLKATISDLEQKVSGYENQIKDQNALIEGWKTKWFQAVQGTTISKEASPSVAEKILQQYEKCAKDYDSYLEIDKQQHAIREQIQLFEDKVNELLQTLQMNLDEPNPAFSVNKLYTILQKAKEDQVTLSNLTTQYEKLQTSLKETTRNVEKEQAILVTLYHQANCHNLDELKEIEGKFMQKKTFMQSLYSIEEEMLSQGNGKSIQELIHEASPFDDDLIEGDLESIETELEMIENERSEIEQAYGVVKKEYEEKVQGITTGSVEVEQEKSSVHAQIATLTEQYVQLKLASILLQKGIEEYRNRNQDPILMKAGEIFKQLTLDSFIDLTVDYDEKDQPILIGVKNTGEKVTVEGMSDGTTDQLYLALRIASIEAYMKENMPIPFIVDDILVHFDDERSKQTLKILLELSKHTQIIFFTHHSRLLEIMKEISTEKEYQLIEINHKEPVLQV